LRDPKQADAPASARRTSLDGQWLLAIDPENVGREQAWFAAPVPEAKPPKKVPRIIQDAFPGYHGLAAGGGSPPSRPKAVK